MNINLQNSFGFKGVSDKPKYGRSNKPGAMGKITHVPDTKGDKFQSQNAAKKGKNGDKGVVKFTNDNFTKMLLTVITSSLLLGGVAGGVGGCAAGRATAPKEPNGYGAGKTLDEISGFYDMSPEVLLIANNYKLPEKIYELQVPEEYDPTKSKIEELSKKLENEKDSKRRIEIRNEIQLLKIASSTIKSVAKVYITQDNRLIIDPVKPISAGDLRDTCGIKKESIRNNNKLEWDGTLTPMEDIDGCIVPAKDYDSATIESPIVIPLNDLNPEDVRYDFSLYEAE